MGQDWPHLVSESSVPFPLVLWPRRKVNPDRKQYRLLLGAPPILEAGCRGAVGLRRKRRKGELCLRWIPPRSRDMGVPSSSPPGWPSKAAFGRGRILELCCSEVHHRGEESTEQVSTGPCSALSFPPLSLSYFRVSRVIVAYYNSGAKKNLEATLLETPLEGTALWRVPSLPRLVTASHWNKSCIILFITPKGSSEALRPRERKHLEPRSPNLGAQGPLDHSLLDLTAVHRMGTPRGVTRGREDDWWAEAGRWVRPEGGSGYEGLLTFAAGVGEEGARQPGLFILGLGADLGGSQEQP